MLRSKRCINKDKVVGILEKIFSKPGKVKFSNIHLLAVLLGALHRYHQEFAISVIDNVLENITLGLEQNDFRFNQRRIAEVKYLGELYNYKMVDSAVIFDTLYRIVTFGHDGIPMPGKSTGFDVSDDFFRIRLISTILETCGICFDRGSSRKRLDFFLTFFQYYLTTKDPLPMDVEFVVIETFALVRPQWKLIADLAEAGKLFQESIQANYKQEIQDKPAEAVEDVDESASEDDLEERADPEAEEVHSSTDENEVSMFPRAFTCLLINCRPSMATTTLLRKKLILKRSTSSLRDQKSSLTPRLKLTSIENSRK